MKFHVDHVFRGVDLPAYEKLYFDEDFNIALCKAVKLARTVEKLEENDGRLTRVVRVGPDREIPKPIAKLAGTDRIEYTEHLTYSHGSYHADWYTVSSILSDRVDTRGTVEFKEAPNGVRRTVDGEIKVKVFGLGKVVEKFIVSDIERSYEQAATFTQRWIESGGRV